MLQKSVVLVTVDCLRGDHCGFMGYGRPTTPFLDSLAKESFVFPTAIVAGVPTYYSFPAILASRYPLALGREVLGLLPEEKSLTSVLKDNGYATAFFGAGNPYLAAGFGYDFGFDRFHDFMDDLTHSSSSNGAHNRRRRTWTGMLNSVLATGSRRIPGFAVAYDELYFQYCQRKIPSVESLDVLRRFPAADVIVDQARSWLASMGKDRFFLWIHLMDPHSPYYPTEKGVEILGEKSVTTSRARYLNAYWNRSDVGRERLQRHRDEVIALYDAGVRWVDAQLSRLVQILRQFKLWQNCVFALTADHGEEFLEHNSRYHAPSLTEELIHVPLLLRVPGAEKKQVCGNPFSLLHLAPTLLAAAELAAPPEFQGQSHWKDIQEGTPWTAPSISECIAGCTNPFNPEQRQGARLLSIREARYKLLLNFNTGGHDLFDLQADPGERTPLSNETAKPERRRLLQAALEHLRNACTRQTSHAYVRALLRDIDLNVTSAFATADSSPPGQRIEPDRPRKSI